VKTSQTNSAVAVPQPRLWPRVRIGGILGYAAIWAFFGVFLIYPLIRLFYDAFTTDQGQFTLLNFSDFFTDSYYLKATMNSLLLGVGTVMTTSILGIAIAYLLLRYEFRGRELFSYLTIIPMIMPPLVGVMGFVFIMGRAGTVNVLLMDYLGFTKPVNFMYGIHGVLLVETLHLFPLMTLSIVDALGKIDPSSMKLQRASGRGASGSSGYTFLSRRQGTCLVRFWSSSGLLQIFATPLVVGIGDLLASQAYLNIVQFVDRRLFKMGIVISAIMIILAIIFLIIAKQYVAIKDYSSLSYSKLRGGSYRLLPPLQQLHF